MTTMCTTVSTTNTGLPLYLYHRDFPAAPIRSADTNCSCSVETASCTSQINVYFVHFELADEGGLCRGTQKIEITDNETEQTFSCSENTYYSITLKMTSSGNYLTISLDNSAATNDGYFWIGFEGRHLMKSLIYRNIKHKHGTYVFVFLLLHKRAGDRII